MKTTMKALSGDFEIVTAAEDETGRPIQPEGFVTASEHAKEETAIMAATANPLAVKILKYTTATNRSRYRVLKASTFVWPEGHRLAKPAVTS